MPSCGATPDRSSTRVAGDGKGEPLGINEWDRELFVSMLKDMDPETPAHEIAFAKWLDLRSKREQARQARPR